MAVPVISLPLNTGRWDNPKILYEIGLCAMAWSQFEMLIEMAYRHYKGEPYDLGRDLTGARDTSKKLTFLLNTAENSLKGKEASDLANIGRRGQVAARNRNMVFHGKPLGDWQMGSLRFVSFYQLEETDPAKVLYASQIIETAAEIAELANLTCQLLVSVGASPFGDTQQ